MHILHQLIVFLVLIEVEWQEVLCQRFYVKQKLARHFLVFHRIFTDTFHFVHHRSQNRGGKDSNELGLTQLTFLRVFEYLQLIAKHSLY